MNVDGFKEKPERLFWVFALAHAFLWTIVPTFSNPNLPIDVIEGLTWGHEWQLGYHKHPIMKPWMLESVAVLSGRADWAQYLLSQVCVIGAFWAVWQLAKEFLSKKWALLSILLLEGIYYHNYTSPEFNVNVAELPFWALTCLCTWRAIDRGANRYAILAGLFMGLGILSKYVFGFLILAIMFMVLAVKPFRKILKTRAPYLAFATAALVILPHLVWVVQNDFITITYGLDRTVSSDFQAIAHLFYPVRFLIGQAVILIPVLIMLAMLRGKDASHDAPLSREYSKKQFLLFTSLGPPVLLALLSAVFGWKIRSMWGTPLFLLSGLTLVYFFRQRLTLRHWRKFAIAWALFFLLSPTIYWAETRFLPIYSGFANRVHYPGKALADTTIGKWRQRYRQLPGTIIGDFWDAGNISYHTPHRPSVFIDGDRVKSPWITLSDIRRTGAIIVGVDRENAYSMVPQGISEVVDEGEISLPYQYEGDVPPLRLWMLMLPPEKSKGASGTTSKNQSVQLLLNNPSDLEPHA
jgi:4-amino-4-deoxy-L-arabinose transferase-like glycosyltransferase